MVQRLKAHKKDHKEIKAKFEELFAQNEEAICKHNEIKRVFEQESQAFFLERLKWKSDVQ